MANLSASVDDSEVRVALADLDPQIEANLLTVEAALDQELLSRIIAASPDRTGRFRKSLSGRVVETPTGAWAEVIANDPIASFIEYGAVIPPHEILPDTARALAFMVDGRHIVTGKVELPGGTIKAEHILSGQLQAMRDEITMRLQEAADGAAEAF